MSLTMVSYGGGINSTAMLVECVKRGIQVDLILFADTGGEKPHTYKYIKYFSKWLASHGFPSIHRVQTTDCYGTYITLEQKCYELNQLPSKAYGSPSCSDKFKIRPQNKFVNNWEPARQTWKDGNTITKLIGFDADESHRIRDYSDNKYTTRYPLVEWDMGREECLLSIQEAELDIPGKSACFFCPNSKPSEIRQLANSYPMLAERALRLEAAAELTNIKGLGRRFSWANLLNEKEEVKDSSISSDMPCACYDG